MARQAAKAGLTQCGTEWLIQALDPYHDTARTPTGYPDTNANSSVIQVVKQSYQLVTPIAAGNWDCNVVMLPWINPITMTQTVNGGNQVPPRNILTQPNPATTTDVVVGGIQVLAAASGGNLDISIPAVAGTNINQSFSIPNTYLQGNSRVVGMAMEICNTTSDLNRQGLVTCYRIPVPQNDDGTTMITANQIGGDTNIFTGAADVVFIPKPPLNIAGAQLFAGTKAWGAEEGSYQVAGFNTPDVPANGLNFTQPALYTTSQTDAAVLFAHMTRTAPVASIGGYAEVPAVSWTEMDMSGSFFTGLSNSTTLTVNYVVIIERFPTQDDLDLIVSAKRSPEYDVKALEAYSEIYQSLPVAVPFGENGWGDWFDTIANTASSVLGMIPHPYAQAASVLVGGAKKIKDQFDQPVSDTRVERIPQAPPMSAPRKSRNVNTSQLKLRKSNLKKVITRENKFENRVRNELKGAGKIVRGKNAPRAPKY